MGSEPEPYSFHVVIDELAAAKRLKQKKPIRVVRLHEPVPTGSVLLKRASQCLACPPDRVVMLSTPFHSNMEGLLFVNSQGGADYMSLSYEQTCKLLHL